MKEMYLSVPVSVWSIVKRWREIGLHDRPSKLTASRYSALVRGQTNTSLCKPVHTRGSLFPRFERYSPVFLRSTGFFCSVSNDPVAIDRGSLPASIRISSLEINSVVRFALRYAGLKIASTLLYLNAFPKSVTHLVHAKD